MIAVVSCGHRPDDERIYHRQIKSLINAGYEVQYFTRFDGELNVSEIGLNHTNYPRKDNSVQTFAKKVEADLSKSKADMLQIHEFELLPMAGRVKKSTGVKIIYDVHDTLTAMWDTVSSKRGLAKKAINAGLDFYEKRNLKHVDQTILANPAFEISHYETAGIPTTVVPNYPSLSFLEKENTPKTGKKILYQGLLSEDRGIDILIQAFEYVINKHPDAELQLLGPAKSEEYREHLQRYIASKSNRIQMMDEIPHGEVWGIMSNAAVGVIPSLDSPRVRCDTPTKLFEYMAAGCAVVATNLLPVRHHAGESILYAAPGNHIDLAEKIVSILDSKDLFTGLTEKAKLLIKEKYNWEQAEPAFLNVFAHMKK